MSETAKLNLGGKEFELPVLVGTENERAIDVGKLRDQTGYITFDDGYGNTGSCESRITYIDGDAGVLRHRGIPIEQLAESSTFIETSYMLIYGDLPTRRQMASFSGKVLKTAGVHESMRHLFEGFPSGSHPMAILSALLNSLGCYYPQIASNDRAQDLENFDEAAAILLSKVRTLAAMTYRMKNGLPFVYPRRDLGYSQNLLHMMFSEPYHDYYPHDDVTKAMDLILMLHADHEQNCSTSTVRMVASGGANLFASVAAGVCALWGPLHGGANMAVIQMLEEIRRSGDDGSRFVEDAKNGKARLMGFGHRVYKNYDPRAKILKAAADRILQNLPEEDPLLRIALKLEEIALNEEYFLKRKLYPNVDFYSGILLRAIGLPMEFFTVIFAIGRMPGWIANWKEVAEAAKGRIYRPRQVYQGSTLRDYVRMRHRDPSSPQPIDINASEDAAENASYRA